MRISEAAKATGLSVSNIRFYERKGLLAPSREEDSKYRDYTEEDIEQLKRIILFRKMDVPVETISLIETNELDLRKALERQQEILLEKLLLANGMFVFVIPSGTGLYYFISGLFSAVEQFAVHRTTVKKLSITV